MSRSKYWMTETELLLYVCNCGETLYRRSVPTCTHCGATMALVQTELPDNVVSMVGRKRKP